jgi:peptidoglycan/LPS O-acetylase OafA/YrhL
MANPSSAGRERSRRRIIRTVRTNRTSWVGRAVFAIALALMAFRLVVVSRHLTDPSLAVSALSNLAWPVLVGGLTLSFAARGDLTGSRDLAAAAAGLTAALALMAAGISVDQRLDAADAFLYAAGWLFGVTVLVLAWAAVGRRKT